MTDPHNTPARMEKTMTNDERSKIPVTRQDIDEWENRQAGSSVQDLFARRMARTLRMVLDRAEAAENEARAAEAYITQLTSAPFRQPAGTDYSDEEVHQRHEVARLAWLAAKNGGNGGDGEG